MPLHEDENGRPAIPEGYTGKVISVVLCPTHGAHINLDLRYEPQDIIPMMTNLSAPDAFLFPIDRMTPEKARIFAADLLAAADEAEQYITAARN